MENRQIFVVCEYKKGQNTYRDVTLELLGKACELKKQAKEEFSLEYEVCAVVMDSGIDADFCILSGYGAQKIYYMKNKHFSDYDCVYYSKALVELINLKTPEIVLFGATDKGRELAPYVTSHLKTGLTADCTQLALVENKGEIKLAATRPTFGGVLMATILSKKNPQCATLREGVFKKRDFIPQNPDVENINFDDTFFNIKSPKILEKIPEKEKENNISNARVILCGGRGLKTKENFEKLKKLAKLTGCAYGATRGAVDSNLAPYEVQIGQTGKTVSPDIYVAFGVSGAIHHILGMNSSKTVIAINTDSNAPIFKNCDYKLQADAIEVLDKLLKKFS